MRGNVATYMDKIVVVGRGLQREGVRNKEEVEDASVEGTMSWIGLVAARLCCKSCIVKRGRLEWRGGNVIKRWTLPYYTPILHNSVVLL